MYLLFVTDFICDKIILDYKNNIMAKNVTRTGSVRKRDQVFSPKNKRWTKRSTDSGRFMDQKADKKPFRSVKKKK